MTTWRRKRTRRGLKCATPSELYFYHIISYPPCTLCYTTCYHNNILIFSIYCNMKCILNGVRCQVSSATVFRTPSGRVIVFTVVFYSVRSGTWCVCLWNYRDNKWLSFARRGYGAFRRSKHDSAHGKRKPRTTRRRWRRLQLLLLLLHYYYQQCVCSALQ